MVDQFDLFSWVERQAANRQLQHRELGSRGDGDIHEVMGMIGEIEFGKFSGLCPDFDLKPKGDDGVDFVVPLNFTLDVKTFRNAQNLLHRKGKPFADIYVLAEYSEATDEATLIGWEWGAALARVPVRCFGVEDIHNHYIHRDRLRPMSDLKRRLHSV